MAAVSLALPLVVFIAVVAAVLFALGGEKVERRKLQTRLAGYSQTGRQQPQISVEAGTILRQRQFSDLPAFQSVLRQSSFADRLAEDLARAGVPLRVGEYLLIRWICSLGLATVVIVTHRPWVIAVILAVVGFQLPKLYVQRRERSRRVKFNDQLVDALTMMANALKAGASFLQAMDLVAREMPDPIASEFGLVVAEVSVGATMDEALHSLHRRVQSYDLYLVVTAMLVQRQTGGSLAEVLEKIAHTIRERTQILRQVQVLTGEQRMSAIVVGLLPVAIVVALSVLSPDYMNPFLQNPLGRVLLGVAGALDGLGFLVMRRMANIDV